MSGRGVLVVGSANMDLVVRAERFPAPGETIFGTSFDMFPGGKGANQAVACAKLGGEVHFLGKMGKDLFGSRLVSSMRRDGVLLRHVVFDRSSSTGTALISVDGTGQNEIVVISGSNMRLLPADLERKKELFRKAAVLLVQLEIPVTTVLRAVKLARARGLAVVLNPAPAVALPPPLLELVDYLTPNETELHLLTNRPVNSLSQLVAAARLLVKQGVSNVLVTLGKRGCLLVNEGSHQLFPSYRVKAVDSTAAGDAFNGAIAFAIARQQPLEKAIPFANAVAALSVTRPGAQSSMPTWQETRRFLTRKHGRTRRAVS